MNIYQKFGPGSFAVIERKLARGEFIAGAELALVLRANPDVPLPPAICEYLIRLLEGKVKAPRGRKPPDSLVQLRDIYAASLYERYLPWLRARRRRLGLSDSPTIDWWKGPPHERATRMVARRLRRSQSWRHIQNMVSRQR